MSSSRIACLHASPAYQTATEGLGKLLQDTGTSIEGLLSSYIAASVKLLGPEVSNVRSSLSMRTAPTVINSRQEAQTNAFYKDDAAASELGPTQFQASANILQCLDVQNWSTQSPSSLLCHENSSSVFASNDDVNFSDVNRSLPGTSSPRNASSDEDALRGLLDEVKTTVCNWLLRHKTIVQDRLSAHELAAGSPGLCLPNAAPFLVGFEREESLVVCTRPLGDNTTDEEGYQTQKEQKDRLGNVHPTQNDGGKGGEFVQKNQEEGNRCGLHHQQDEEVGHFSLQIEMGKSVHLDEALEDIACQLQSDEQPMAKHSLDLVGGEPAAELSPAESLSADVNVASTAAIAGSAPLLKKNGLAAKEGNRGRLLPHQQDKEAGHFSLEIETERSMYLEEVGVDIALQLQSDGRPMARHLQGLVGGKPASRLSQAESLSTDVNVVSTAANSGSTPLLKENELAAESLLTPINMDQAEIQLSITEWTPPASTIDKSLSFPRAVKVVASPDWLPEGWVTELKTRGTGNSAGTKDKYYVDPVSNRRFRSRKEVVAYLERGKLKPSGGNPDTSLVKKLPAPWLLPALPNIANKRAKVKESGTGGASAKPPPLVSPIASAGLIGNVFMPPFRTGQPSEWLSYESVGSLPFPMFDPFYHRDMSAKKSTSSGKAPPVSTRPSFFTGPADSWNPFRDRSSLAKPADKGRDYQSYFSMPSYPSGVVPKPFAGLVKKSSK